MRVVVAGGAHVNNREDFFNIGKRNFMAVRKIFWKNNVITNYHCVGGNSNRTLKIFIKDGHIFIKDSCEGLIKI